MKIKLSLEKKCELEIGHRQERDKHVCDRIKAVLLRDEGWSVSRISQALRLHNDTISRYLTEYATTGSVETKYQGSTSKLNDKQAEELARHVEENLYDRASDICAYVKKSYGIEYSQAGMVNWLQQHKFSYKNPKEQPAKADLVRQKEFVENYLKLLSGTPKNEPKLFMDSVHPTMASKSSRGWIREGKDKILLTSASRTRMNISGVIELSTMKTVIESYETINGETTISFLEKVKLAYPRAKRIHIILDQSGYHRSGKVAEFSKENGITLHFLPPYSPNLNPIERLWKVMNERVRNNYYFTSAKEFRERIMNFFSATLPDIAKSLVSRINDNFHILEAANSFLIGI